MVEKSYDFENVKLTLLAKEEVGLLLAHAEDSLLRHSSVLTIHLSSNNRRL